MANVLSGLCIITKIEVVMAISLIKVGFDKFILDKAFIVAEKTNGKIKAGY